MRTRRARAARAAARAVAGREGSLVRSVCPGARRRKRQRRGSFVTEAASVLPRQRVVPSRRLMPAMGPWDVPPFQILDPRHPPLRVRHHLGEQVGEAGPAELGVARAVQVAVVDRLAVRGDAEARGRGGTRQ